MSEPVEVTGRTCTKCKTEKSAKDFYRRGDGTGKLRHNCIQCMWGPTVKRGRKRRPDVGLPGAAVRSHKEKNLFYAYGLTLEAYDSMLTGQKGVCAICKKPEPMKNTSLSVDHDHATGKIRGLLCGHCNRGLGLFSDSPELLVQAAEYLRRS